MKSHNTVRTMCAALLAVIIVSCTRERPAEALPSDQSSASRQLVEALATPTGSHPVYQHYLRRFKSKVSDLEKKVVALNRATEGVKKRDAPKALDAIAEFENLVRGARAELDVLQKDGPSPRWEVTRDRTDRAIVSAERAFDSLTLRFGIEVVKK